MLDSVLSVLNGALDGAVTLLAANYLLGERILQAIQIALSIVAAVVTQVRRPDHVFEH